MDESWEEVRSTFFRALAEDGRRISSAVFDGNVWTFHWPPALVNRLEDAAKALGRLGDFFIWDVSTRSSRVFWVKVRFVTLWGRLESQAVADRVAQSALDEWNNFWCSCGSKRVWERCPKCGFPVCGDCVDLHVCPSIPRWDPLLDSYSKEELKKAGICPECKGPSGLRPDGLEDLGELELGLCTKCRLQRTRGRR